MSTAQAQTSTTTHTGSRPQRSQTDQPRSGGAGHRGQRHTVLASTSIPISPNLIGAVVGKSGATINKIKEATRTRISHLDPNPGNGHLFDSFHISGSPQGVDRARKWILSIIANTYRADHPDEFQDEGEGAGEAETN